MLTERPHRALSVFSPVDNDLAGWLILRAGLLALGVLLAVAIYLLRSQDLSEYSHIAGAHVGALLINLILTALLLYPLCDYLNYGWVRRKEEIDSSMTTEAKRIYFSVWLENSIKYADADVEFENYYVDRYGRWRFIVPILFVFLIAIVENYVLGQAAIEVTQKSTTTTPANEFHLPAAAAAIAGAYTFVTWDFFARVQRRALSTMDVLRGALRLGMAIPLGFAFTTLDQSIAPFLAYGVGVFPLDALRTLLWRLVSKYLKVDEISGASPDSITKLSGIDADIADRIADADITTIPQLAWCDPIQLIMRSNLSFDYVVDIVCQALAWVYIGDDLKKLRPYGLRGAYEIRVLKEQLDSDDPKIKSAADALVSVAAAALGIAADGLRNAIAQIADDRATTFLYEASLSDPSARDQGPAS